MSADNVDYYAKYLKYNNKYIELKNKVGGSSKKEKIMTPAEFYKEAYKKLMTVTGSSHCAWTPGTANSVNRFDQKVIDSSSKKV